MGINDPFNLDVRVVVPKTARIITRMTEDIETDTTDVAGTDLSRCRECPDSLTCSVVRCPTRRRSPCCVVA